MRFRPLSTRARWAIVALVAIALLDAVAVWADWDRYDLLNRIVNGGNVTLDEADASDQRQSVIGVLQISALAVGAVFLDSIDSVAAALAVIVILRITARQEERAAKRALPVSA